MLSGSGLLWFAAAPLVALFSTDPQVIRLGTDYLHVDGFILPVYLALFAVNAMLQAFKRPMATVWIGIWRQGIAVGLFCWLLCHGVRLGHMGRVVWHCNRRNQRVGAVAMGAGPYRARHDRRAIGPPPSAPGSVSAQLAIPANAVRAGRKHRILPPTQRQHCSTGAPPRRQPAPLAGCAARSFARGYAALWLTVLAARPLQGLSDRTMPRGLP